jgi:hypothetical protein
MAEKFRYGPLVFNSFGEEDDSGNYWWPGNPPVAYEQPTGVYRIPVDSNGNQCLPGECILHPNCRVEEWESFELFKIPSLSWCKEWFDENFLVVSDYQVCRYIVRWCGYNYQHRDDWKEYKLNNTINEMIGEIWPDVQI